MNNTEQNFLNELDDKLWQSAEKLRSSMDAANYKHVVLGLIFLKYVSDAFEERQRDLIALFKDERDNNIYHLPRSDYDSEEEYQKAVQAELELADYYKEKNVVWVPPYARWKYIQETAALPIGATLWKDSSGGDVKLRSVSWLVDNALDEIEKTLPIRLLANSMR